MTITSLLGLGIALVTASASAQGFIQFQNNNFGGNGFGALDAPVTFLVTGVSPNGTHGTAGVAVGSEFTADLLYSLDGGATYNTLTAAGANDPSYPPHFGIPVAADGDTANFAGYFFGGTATIPGYSSGPVTFIVRAWEGGTSFNNSFGWIGQSAPFTLASITPSGSTALPSDLIGMPAFTVGPIPEPSIFAFAGLSAVGLMAFRRRK